MSSRFDLTLFAEDDVTPFFGEGDEYGVEVADFSTDPAHPRPYLGEVKNWSATEVDFAGGSSTIGAITVDVLDKRTEAGDQDTGILTARLGEVVGKRALLRRLRDGEMVTAFEGIVNGYSMGGSPEGLVLISLGLRDVRELERNQGLFSSNFVLFGKDGEQGPAIDYGLFPGGGYLLPAVLPQEATFARWVTGEGITAGFAPVPASKHINLLDLGRSVPGGDGIYYHRDIRIQWRAAGTSDPWVTLRDMPSVSYTNAVDQPFSGVVAGLFGSTSRVYFASFAEADIPADEQEIEFLILAVEVTEDTPFFWDGGTFGDLLREIYDGDLGTTGSRAVPYNVAGMDAFAAATPPARVIATESADNMREWVEQNIYQAVGYAPAFDEEQRVYPVRWGLPANTADIPVIEVSAIVPIGDWEHGAENVINTVEYTYLREGLADQETTQQKKGRRKYLFFGPRGTTTVEGELSPWDRYLTVPVTRTWVDEASVRTFGPKKLAIKPVTVRAIGDVYGRTARERGHAPRADDTSDELGTQLAEDIAASALLRFKRGAPVLGADALASDSTVNALKIGDWLRPRGVTWFPTPSGTRDPLGYFQVRSINDENPIIRRLSLVDSGVPDHAAGADAACLSGGTAAFTPSGTAALVFSADGTLTNACGHDVTLPRLLLIAGGGGGGTGGGSDTPGGGGAGGVLVATDVLIAAGASIPITRGAGGAGGASGGDTVFWADADGEALIPGVDTPLVTLRAIGGGRGGNAAGHGIAGGSGGGGGETYPISGGNQSDGGPGTAGQGNDGGGGESSGGLATCQHAAGGGGGSYGGAGTSGDASDPAVNPIAAPGGPSTFLTDWGVTAGAGGSGPHQKQEAGGVCPDAFGVIPGATGSGYGAGGGGGGLSGLAGILLVEYAGPAPVLEPPTVTSTTVETDGRVTVCVEEADWPLIALEDYRVRVDYATGAVEPDATSGDWRLAGYLDAPGCVTTPPVPTGATVWSRATAEASAFLPSEPTTAEESATPETPGLLAYRLTIDADGTAVVTWTANAYAGVVRIRGMIHEVGDSVARPLDHVADVLAPVGTYTLPGTVSAGQYYTLDLEAWSDAVPPDGVAPILLDDFTRANNSVLGGDWTIRAGGGGWSITSNQLRCDGSNDAAYAENDAGAVGESFVQSTLLSAIIANAQAQIVSRFDWAAGSPNGYVFGPDQTVPGWRLWKLAAGVLSSLGTVADTLVDNVGYGTQLYTADGVQEAWRNGKTIAAADTTYDAVETGTVAARKRRTSGTPVVTWDLFYWFGTKYVTISDLPTGWKAKVLAAGDVLIATATEVAGVARVDCSRFGGATANVPAAGWAAVIVTDAADVEQARYDAAAIYPGSVDGIYLGGTISGVAGEGSTYRASELQPEVTLVLTANATSIQDFPVSTTDPTNGQVIMLVGGAYTPTSLLFSHIGGSIADAQVPLTAVAQHQGSLAVPAGGLTGNTLAAGVVTSSLTTIGTLVAGAVPASLVTAGAFPTGTFSFPAFVIVGHTAGIDVGTNAQRLSVHGLSGNAQFSITRWSNNASAPIITLGKSRGATVGTYTIVQAGDILGRLDWYGTDGVAIGQSAAGFSVSIRAVVASSPTPAALRIPAYLSFLTAAGAADNDGAEKMRLGHTAVADLGLIATAKLRLDGVALTGDTYIHESGANVMGLVVGGATVLSMTATAATITGTLALTSRLLLAAGTTALAPLVFVSGPVLTVPLAGRMEYLTDDFFLTITTGAARKGIVLDDGARLTSGRVPAATTNGRLVDGPVPAADGTYPLPVSITIVKGLITAIS